MLFNVLKKNLSRLDSLIVKYNKSLLRLDLSDNKLTWFDDFLGVGYNVTDYHPNIYLIFDERKKPVNAWNKIIKYWPDDEIKIRFVESGSRYDFVLYCPSQILLATWVFHKPLKISDNYESFKEEFNGIAKLQLALYMLKKGKLELEIYKYKKKVTDIKFLNKDEVGEDFILTRSLENVKNDFKQSG